MWQNQMDVKNQLIEEATYKGCFFFFSGIITHLNTAHFQIQRATINCFMAKEGENKKGDGIHISSPETNLST